MRVAWALLCAAGAAAAPERSGLPASAKVAGREVVFHQPQAAQADARDVVFALHGLSESATTPTSICNNRGHMAEHAARLGFIAVCPSGAGSSWNAAGCCDYAAENGVDDVAYIREVVAYVKRRASVRKVYAIGFSNGAMLAWRLACEAADVFDGIAPNSGAWYGRPAFTLSSSVPLPLGWLVDPAQPEDCSGQWPTSSNSGCWRPQTFECKALPDNYPVLYTHGTADDNEPYKVDTAAFRHYAEGVLGCTGTGKPWSSGDATCMQYQRCASGRRVGFCSVAGLAHEFSQPDAQGFDPVDLAVSWWGGGWPAAARAAAPPALRAAAPLPTPPPLAGPPQWGPGVPHTKKQGTSAAAAAGAIAAGLAASTCVALGIIATCAALGHYKRKQEYTAVAVIVEEAAVGSGEAAVPPEKTPACGSPGVRNPIYNSVGDTPPRPAA